MHILSTALPIPSMNPSDSEAKFDDIGHDIEKTISSDENVDVVEVAVDAETRYGRQPP